MTELSAPLRDMLKTLYRRWVKTEADKNSLAAMLNQSVSSLSNLAKGEGSLNTWWGLILWKTGLPSQDLANQLYAAAKKRSSLSESDLVWNSLDAKLTEHEKLYWAKVIEAAIAVEKPIKMKKSSE